ncbi:MAG: Rieske (2Fe-2S) protein [Gemmatimonadaceae bacterium]
MHRPDPAPLAAPSLPARDRSAESRPGGADHADLRADADHACGGCELRTSRRSFLGGVAAALALFAVEGILPRDAQALPAREVTGERTAPQETAYAIPAADGVAIDKKEGVIIARYAGSVYAFALTCPHQNTALRWNDGAHEFQCPRHKSKYRPDGVFISGRATRAMDRFAVRKDGERLVVNLDKLYEQDADAAGWGSAKVAV